MSGDGSVVRGHIRVQFSEAWMPATNRKHEVHLSAEQRTELEDICRQQNVTAAKARRARILLLADEDHGDRRRPDWHIAEVVGLSERQVVRIRRQFVRE